jgi:EpsI family protein
VSPAIRRLLQVVLVIAVVAALYWPTSVSYSVAWTDFDNRSSTHGYLIAFMCLALLYLRRAEFLGALPRTSMLACLALALLSCAWVVVFRASIQTAHQLLLPIIFWTAVAAVFGWRIARSCLFPIGYLYFALPFWAFINEPLQALTILATRLLLLAIGLPVSFSGNLVQIPDGSFVIEGGCSGLHFFVVALAIAAFYGALHRDRLRHRLLLLALAAGLALVTNWIRVSTIITAGHLTHMQSYLVRVSHYGFGWALFAVAMSIFFVVASRMPLSAAANARVPIGSSGAQRAAPGGVALVLVFLSVAVGPMLAWMATRGDAIERPTPSLAPRVDGWSGPVATPNSWRPVFVGADTESLVAYRRGAAEVEWYAADYAFQRQGKKLLGYDNSMFDPRAYAVLDEGAVAAAAQQFVQLRLQDTAGAQSLIWYFYEIDGHPMTSGLRAELFYGWHSLIGPIDSRVIAWRTSCDPDCAAAQEQLRLFSTSICDNASRFDNCRRDRRRASDKLKKTPIASTDESR